MVAITVADGSRVALYGPCVKGSRLEIEASVGSDDVPPFRESVRLDRRSFGFVLVFETRTSKA
jgi:hypothetical protein